jgi:hypothetical protein
MAREFASAEAYVVAKAVRVEAALLVELMIRSWVNLHDADARAGFHAKP